MRASTAAVLLTDRCLAPAAAPDSAARHPPAAAASGASRKRGLDDSRSQRGQVLDAGRPRGTLARVDAGLSIDAPTRPMGGSYPPAASRRRTLRRAAGRAGTSAEDRLPSGMITGDGVRPRSGQLASPRRRAVDEPGLQLRPRATAGRDPGGQRHRCPRSTRPTENCASWPPADVGPEHQWGSRRGGSITPPEPSSPRPASRRRTPRYFRDAATG